ncbi:hypothetical protein RKD19_004311 [Streptomyces canus]
MEDQAEGLLLRPVELEHFGQQERPEAGDGGPDRNAVPDAAEGVELRGKAGGLPPLVHFRGPGLHLLVPRARCGDPRHVALDVGEEDGNPLRRQLLGDELERLGLAGAGGSGHEPVPVEHRQRDPDLRVREADPVPQQRAQIERGTGEGVAGGDLQGLLGQRGGAGLCLRHGTVGGRRGGPGSALR